ncbi:MmpS family transport accessory protein [Mycolicibacterium baixiangningiae]|uniref:MmpS family transport accessory protein n=1 Tax=Mycolicibacterium baixiangningiae TaxID=2761578 RepID=UPI0018692F83|nr:MmpS family transport accessory protein [Mycolicibacterium baixiangningiae]
MGKFIIGASCVILAVASAPVAGANAGSFAYVLKSDAPIMSASFFDGMNEMQTVMDLPSSWSQTFSSEATYQMHSISAQTNGTVLSCQLLVNGSVVDEQTTKGRYTVTVCSG